MGESQSDFQECEVERLQSEEIEMSWPLKFIVPIKAQGKGRARSAGKRHYTPTETVAFERMIANVARREMRISKNEMLTGAVVLDVLTQFKPKGKNTIKDPCTVKPDASNVLKSVEDALNGVVYTDDKNIVQTGATKEYAHEDSILITVWPHSTPTLEELTE